MIVMNGRKIHMLKKKQIKTWYLILWEYNFGNFEEIDSELQENQVWIENLNKNKIN